MARPADGALRRAPISVAAPSDEIDAGWDELPGSTRTTSECLTSWPAASVGGSRKASGIFTLPPLKQAPPPRLWTSESDDPTVEIGMGYLDEDLGMGDAWNARSPLDASADTFEQVRDEDLFE